MPKPLNKQFSPKNVIELYKQGCPIKDIAAVQNCSIGKIYTCLKENVVEFDRYKNKKFIKNNHTKFKDIGNEAAKLYSEGISVKEIAKKLHCAEGTVHKKLNDVGVEKNRHNNQHLIKRQKPKNFLDIDNEVIELYEEGVLVKDIAKKFNCNRTTIQRKVKKYIDPNRNQRINLTSKDIKDIIATYLSSPKVTALGISRIYKISSDSILRILRENNIQIRRPRKHLVNEEFFTEDHEDVYYIVGLIASDGCIQREIDSFSIIQADYPLLKKIALRIGSDENVIYKHKNTNTLTLKIRSEKMVNDLITKFGMHDRKSRTIMFPKMADHYIPHFIRGVIDGDGHVSKREIGVVTASESFALSLFTIFENQQLNPRLNVEKGKNCWLFRIYVRGKENIEALREKLYKGAGDLYLDRKKISFEECYKND